MERRQGRLAGLGIMPMQVPTEAVRESERCTGQLGLKGVRTPADAAGRELLNRPSSPSGRAPALGAPVVVP